MLEDGPAVVPPNRIQNEPVVETAAIAVGTQQRGRRLGHEAANTGKGRAGQGGGADKGKGDKGKGEKGKGKGDQDKNKQILQDAQKLKAFILSLVSDSGAMVTAIQRDEKFAWALNPQNLGKLEQARSALQEKVESMEFTRKFLVEDLAVMKKKYLPETLQNGCQAFMQCKPPAEELSKHFKLLQAMHIVVIG